MLGCQVAQFFTNCDSLLRGDSASPGIAAGCHVVCILHAVHAAKAPGSDREDAAQAVRAAGGVGTHPGRSRHRRAHHWQGSLTTLLLFHGLSVWSVCPDTCLLSWSQRLNSLIARQWQCHGCAYLRPGIAHKQISGAELELSASHILVVARSAGHAGAHEGRGLVLGLMLLNPCLFPVSW